MAGVARLVLSSGGLMPQLGLGTGGIGAWAGIRGGQGMSKEEVGAVINAALECEYRHLDTATLYKNEDMIGDVLQQWLSSGKLTREDLFITSKLPNNGNRKEDVTRFLTRSLNNLQLQYLDLYLVHSPVGTKSDDDEVTFPVDAAGNVVFDMTTDLEAIWTAMEEQVDAGRTKAIGLSCFNSKQIERILKVARIPPAVLQVEVHAYLQQRSLRALCHQHNIAVCAFMCLGSPPRAPGTQEFPKLQEHPLVQEISQRIGKTPSQVLLRHLIQQDVVVIPKSRNPEHMQQNIQVFDFELSEEDIAALNTLDRGPEARVSHLRYIKGITEHPEYPFHLPF